MKLVILIMILSIFISASGEATPERKETTMIVVHHSDTPDGNVANFRKYHVEVRGWNDIGYHYVICRDGTVETGRPKHLVGAHALGRNQCSIGICLVGKNNFTAEQIRSLKFLIESLCMKYKITEIQRHHERCPGPNLPLENITREILG